MGSIISLLTSFQKKKKTKFQPESEQGIFEEVLHGKLDFQSEPWPSISESAKDLVRRMLVRDPKKRLTAHDVLRKYR